MYKKIYFIVVVFSVLPLLLAFIFYYRLTIKDFNKDTIQNIEIEADSVSKQAQQFLGSANNYLEIISKINYFYVALEYNTFENLKDFFNRIILANKQYSSLYFLDNSKNLRAYNTIDYKGQYIDSPKLYSRIKNHLSIKEKSYQVIKVDEKALLVMNKKILDRGGQGTGYLVGIINSEYLDQFYVGLLDKHHSTQYSLLANDSLKVVSSQNYIFNKTEDDLINSCKKIKAEGLKTSLMSCVQIKNKGVYAKYIETRKYFIIALLLSLITIITTSLLLIKTCLKPFRIILTKLQNISCGDYSTIDLKGARTFRKYFDDINLIIEKIITNQKEKENLLKLATMGKVAQFMAHDIRRPFSQIKMMLSMLDSLSADPQKLERAKEDVETSINNVESMLSDIIEINRRPEIDIKPCPLVDVVDKAIGQVEMDCKHISLSSDLDAGLILLCDEDKLTRCFINIIENAVEAISNKDGIGEVKIFSKNTTLNGKRYIEVTVFNSGPLIDVKDMPRLFDSFFTSGKKKGVGIGLAFVYRVVAMHNGKVFANNKQDGSGVEFSVLLPYIEPVRLLLLEDEDLYREMMREMVESLSNCPVSIEVFDVATIEDAIEITKKQNITHALVDLDLMGDSTGFDYIEAVCKMNKRINIAIHTNKMLDNDLLRLTEKYRVDYMPKPLDLNKFYSFIYKNGGSNG